MWTSECLVNVRRCCVWSKVRKVTIKTDYKTDCELGGPVLEANTPLYVCFYTAPWTAHSSPHWCKINSLQQNSCISAEFETAAAFCVPAYPHARPHVFTAHKGSQWEFCFPEVTLCSLKISSQLPLSKKEQLVCWPLQLKYTPSWGRCCGCIHGFVVESKMLYSSCTPHIDIGQGSILKPHMNWTDMTDVLATHHQSSGIQTMSWHT